MKLSRMKSGKTYSLTNSSGDEAIIHVITPGVTPLCVLQGVVNKLGLDSSRYPVVVQLLGYVVDTDDAGTAGDFVYFELDESEGEFTVLVGLRESTTADGGHEFVRISVGCEIRQVAPPAAY